MLAHHDAKLLPGRGRARGRVVGRGELGVGVGGHFVLRIQARHGVIAHTAQVLLQRAAEELDAPELEHALQHRGVRAHLAAVGRRRILQGVMETSLVASAILQITVRSRFFWLYFAVIESASTCVSA